MWQDLKQKISQWPAGAIAAGWAVVGVAVRLPFLTRLPVFADEAIYIYWAQLAMSDWGRFGFYALNDGKTPLHIWGMIPFLTVLSDPLVAGRLVAVLTSGLLIALTIATVRLWDKRAAVSWWTGALVCFCPGLLVNNRLALMDTGVALWTLATFYAAQRSLAAGCARHPKASFGWAVLAGGAFGLGMWTKFSCLMIVPMLVSLPLYWWQRRESGRARWQQMWQLLWPLAVACAVALIMFATLKWAPAFSQIFARGSDFLYSLGDAIRQPGRILLDNSKFFATTLGWYIGGVSMCVSIGAAVGAWRRGQRVPGLLLMSALCLGAPIWCLGKVVYPRYLLPLLPLIVMSLVLGMASWRAKRAKTLVAAGLLVAHMGYAGWLVVAPDTVPLARADDMQLRAEWSAGYGIEPAVDLLEQLTATQSALVLTEGHIGTLPDGLQIYFYGRDSRNRVRIEGVGWPVKDDNFEEWQDVIAQYPQTFLVVNSHRLEVVDTRLELIEQWPRPATESPTLQVYKLKK
ncbi:phospholipid carrier-dependent glycosyltransferase [bacterium]|nr:phospholipid carrier-dependent glycosyltransferase [bacterium]